MRLAFMGTPEFAVPSLDALVAAGHELVAVYTQPPRPANRGKKLTPSALQTRAEELGLPEGQVPFDRLVHPEAIANGPKTLGRDGARTPMPWTAGSMPPPPP